MASTKALFLKHWFPLHGVAEQRSDQKIPRESWEVQGVFFFLPALLQKHGGNFLCFGGKFCGGWDRNFAGFSLDPPKERRKTIPEKISEHFS